MSRSTLRAWLALWLTALYLALACGAGFIAYRYFTPGQRPRGDPSAPWAVFWEAWDHIEQSFYGPLPTPRERTYGAIHETLALLGDPYTIFIEPQPGELERDQLRGVYGGIGVTLWRDAGGDTRLSPHPDSPAQRAGLLEGDIILTVDGRPVTPETDIGDVEAWLHGEVGTAVALTLSRPPTLSFTVVITRAEIRVPSVAWRMLGPEGAPTVGYLRIMNFTGQTGDEVEKALQDLLTESRASALVLDLRDNAGGLLEPAVAAASQFLRDGVVLIEQRRDGQEQAFVVRSGGLATALPLVVLVNGGTASASEIVAGALQDHRRALLVGEPTYGKGSMQLIYNLADGSSLHVTVAIWLTPARRRIEGQGLTPDIHVPPGNGPEDAQLARAVAYLQTQSR